jgi:hypothetical protein
MEKELQNIQLPDQDFSPENLYHNYGTHFVYRVDYGGCFEVISTSEYLKELSVRSVGGNLNVFGNALDLAIKKSSTTEDEGSFVETYSTNNFNWNRSENRVELLKDCVLYPVKFYLAPISLLIPIKFLDAWSKILDHPPPSVTFSILSFKLDGELIKRPTLFAKKALFLKYASSLGKGDSHRDWVFIKNDINQIAIYAIAILRKTYLVAVGKKLSVSTEPFWWDIEQHHNNADNFFKGFSPTLNLCRTVSESQKNEFYSLEIIRSE